MIGTSVDRYEILEELGHGGMSVVYRGLDSSLEREVAVKVLHNHLAKKVENRKRFHREAKAIARLRHRNILEIYDYSSEDADRSYIVMEYVAGENLRQFMVRTGTPPPEVAALIAIEICNALEHAHDHGIIHRDLKPENVMVSSGGELKLMDFGIAHVIDAETMTATGSLMGSPAHMAPELIDGEKVDVRADVFALGTVLFWLSTGTLPFHGANAPQVLRRVLEGDFNDPELIEPKVGQRLGDIIRKCLAHEPDDRYESVVAARKALQAFASSVGLVDLEDDLEKYFKAPDAYRERFDEAIVARLMVLARQAHRERDVPRAIGLFNRILAYDPGNQEVQQLLDQLCRQNRWRRAAPWAAGALLVVGVAAGLMTTFDREEVPPSPVVENIVEEPPPLGVNAVAEHVAESADTATEAISDANSRGVEWGAIVNTRAVALAESEEPRTRIVASPTPTVTTEIAATEADVGVAADTGPPPAPTTYTHRFAIFPAAATFLVDGEIVETFKAKTGIELTEGTHTLTATSRGARPWSDTLIVRGPQEKPKRVVLRWEPAQVQVISNKRAVVWFNGRKERVIGANGRNATFNVNFGAADSTEPEKEIILRVAPADNMEEQRDFRVPVQPGQTVPVPVTFDPEPL